MPPSPSPSESGGRELPEYVIQHIQGFQEGKDAARSCLLSKSWLSAWSTKPTLSFNQTLKTQTYDNFINSVHQTLIKYSDHNILVHSLSLFIDSLDSNLALLLQIWLEIATERLRVKAVYLHLSSITQDQRHEEYFLPLAIFASKSLMILKLAAGGRDHPKLQLMCSDDRIKSRSLTTLYLKRVWLSADTIGNLIASFPLLEKLLVHECKGLDEIHVINLERLKVFSLETTMDHPITVIEIEAPKLLTSFTYKTPFSHSLHDTTYETIFACRNLKRLHLDLQISPWHLISSLANADNFPSLEDLILDYAYGSMNIRSNSLKRLYLRSREISIPKLIIDAPRLRHLSYYGIKVPRLSFPAHTPTHLYTRIGVDADVNLSGVTPDTDLFLLLREFLMEVNRSKLVFVIGDAITSKLDIGDVEALRRAIPIPPGLQVEVLTLLIVASLPLVYTYLLEVLFWICRPAYIHINSFPRSESICVKLLCEKLVVETTNPRCCGSHEIKCWRHELIDVQIMTEEDEIAAAAEFDDGYETSTDNDLEDEFEDKQVDYDKDKWWPLAFHKQGIWQKFLGPNTKGVWLRFKWRGSTSCF